jgi:hypothetical protein
MIRSQHRLGVMWRVRGSSPSSGVQEEQRLVLTPWGTSLYLHRYDPATNTWTARATGPTGHHYPVVGAINGKLYVTGSANHDGASRRR